MISSTEKLDKIKEHMFNGHWEMATLLFQKLNCSAAEYSTYIGELNPEAGYDFCMLGFYSKKFIPKGKE